MLRFDLRKMLEDYEARTGLHVSYENLAKSTDISVDTIKSLVSRQNYNTTLQTVSRLADFLNVSPLKYFSWVVDTQGNDKEN